MDVVYALKRRWGRRATIYSITDINLDLDLGAKVITTSSKTIPRMVFLPPKYVWNNVKQQASYDPRTTTVLIDKRDLLDFPIKLDDYIVSRNWKYVIVEINEHEHSFELKVNAVKKVITLASVSDVLAFGHTSELGA